MALSLVLALTVGAFPSAAPYNPDSASLDSEITSAIKSMWIRYQWRVVIANADTAFKFAQSKLILINCYTIKIAYE